MSIERCHKCGRHVDTDYHDNGLYEDGEYVCVECDSQDAADAIIRLLEKAGLQVNSDWTRVR